MGNEISAVHVVAQPIDTRGTRVAETLRLKKHWKDADLLAIVAKSKRPTTVDIERWKAQRLADMRLAAEFIILIEDLKDSLVIIKTENVEYTVEVPSFRSPVRDALDVFFRAVNQGGTNPLSRELYNFAVEQKFHLPHLGNGVFPSSNRYYLSYVYDSEVSGENVEREFKDFLPADTSVKRLFDASTDPEFKIPIIVRPFIPVAPPLPIPGAPVAAPLAAPVVPLVPPVPAAPAAPPPPPATPPPLGGGPTPSPISAEEKIGKLIAQLMEERQKNRQLRNDALADSGLNASMLALMKDELDSKEDEIANLNTEISNQRQNIEDAKTMETILFDRLNDLQSQLATIDPSGLSNLQTDLDNVRKDLEEQRKKIEKNEQDIEEKTARIDMLTTERADIEAKVDTLQTDLTTANNKLAANSTFWEERKNQFETVFQSLRDVLVETLGEDKTKDTISRILEKAGINTTNPLDLFTGPDPDAPGGSASGASGSSGLASGSTTTDAGSISSVALGDMPHEDIIKLIQTSSVDTLARMILDLQKKAEIERQAQIDAQAAAKSSKPSFLNPYISKYDPEDKLKDHHTFKRIKELEKKREEKIEDWKKFAMKYPEKIQKDANFFITYFTTEEGVTLEGHEASIAHLKNLDEENEYRQQYEIAAKLIEDEKKIYDITGEGEKPIDMSILFSEAQNAVDDFLSTNGLPRNMVKLGNERVDRYLNRYHDDIIKYYETLASAETQEQLAVFITEIREDMETNNIDQRYLDDPRLGDDIQQLNKNRAELKSRFERFESLTDAGAKNRFITVEQVEFWNKKYGKGKWEDKISVRIFFFPDGLYPADPAYKDQPPIETLLLKEMESINLSVNPILNNYWTILRRGGELNPNTKLGRSLHLMAKIHGSFYWIRLSLILERRSPQDNVIEFSKEEKDNYSVFYSPDQDRPSISSLVLGEEKTIPQIEQRERDIILLPFVGDDSIPRDTLRDLKEKEKELAGLDGDLKREKLIEFVKNHESIQQKYGQSGIITKNKEITEMKENKEAVEKKDVAEFLKQIQLRKINEELRLLEEELEKLEEIKSAIEKNIEEYIKKIVPLFEVVKAFGIASSLVTTALDDAAAAVNDAEGIMSIGIKQADIANYWQKLQDELSGFSEEIKMENKKVFSSIIDEYNMSIVMLSWIEKDNVPDKIRITDKAGFSKWFENRANHFKSVLSDLGYSYGENIEDYNPGDPSLYETPLLTHHIQVRNWLLDKKINLKPRKPIVSANPLDSAITIKFEDIPDLPKPDIEGLGELEKAAKETLKIARTWPLNLFLPTIKYYMEYIEKTGDLRRYRNITLQGNLLESADPQTILSINTTLRKIVKDTLVLIDDIANPNNRVFLSEGLNSRDLYDDMKQNTEEKMLPVFFLHLEEMYANPPSLPDKSFLRLLKAFMALDVAAEGSEVVQKFKSTYTHDDIKNQQNQWREVVIAASFLLSIAKRGLFLKQEEEEKAKGKSDSDSGSSSDSGSTTGSTGTKFVNSKTGALFTSAFRTNVVPTKVSVNATGLGFSDVGIRVPELYGADRTYELILYDEGIFKVFEGQLDIDAGIQWPADYKEPSALSTLRPYLIRTPHDKFTNSILQNIVKNIPAIKHYLTLLRQYNTRSTRSTRIDFAITMSALLGSFIGGMTPNTLLSLRHYNIDSIVIDVRKNVVEYHKYFNVWFQNLDLGSVDVSLREFNGFWEDIFAAAAEMPSISEPTFVNSIRHIKTQALNCLETASELKTEYRFLNTKRSRGHLVDPEDITRYEEVKREFRVKWNLFYTLNSHLFEYVAKYGNILRQWTTAYFQDLPISILGYANINTLEEYIITRGRVQTSERRVFIDFLQLVVDNATELTRIANTFDQYSSKIDVYKKWDAVYTAYQEPRRRLVLIVTINPLAIDDSKDTPSHYSKIARNLSNGHNIISSTVYLHVPGRPLVDIKV